MKKAILIAGMFCMIAANLVAQTVSMENVLKPFKTISGAIKEGTEVKGYYFLWANDKIDKNTYEWTLRFCDVSLKTLK